VVLDAVGHIELMGGDFSGWRGEERAHFSREEGRVVGITPTGYLGPGEGVKEMCYRGEGSKQCLRGKKMENPEELLEKRKKVIAEW